MRVEEQKTEPRLDHALERNLSNWQEMRREDPDRWKLEVAKAKVERLFLSTPNHSPAFPELVKEWRMWSDRLWALHALRHQNAQR